MGTHPSLSGKAAPRDLGDEPPARGGSDAPEAPEQPAHHHVRPVLGQPADSGSPFGAGSNARRRGPAPSLRSPSGALASSGVGESGSGTRHPGSDRGTK